LQRIDILRVSFVLLLMTALTAGLSYASAEDNIIRFKVRDVRFVGVEKVNKKELSESLMSKVPPFWKFWKPDPVIHLEDLKDDILRIKQYYQGRGYYQTTAEYEITPVHPEEVSAEQADHKQAPDKSSDLENARVPEYDITFQINEGPPVIIRDITVNCLCELETMSDDQILAAVPLKTGRIFVTEEYEQSKTIIRKLLGNRAYPFASVSGNATVDLNDNSVEISFAVNPGKLYKFGEIRITGNEDYVRENVIRRAITFKSGQDFATKELDESRRNLFDLNIFKTALISMGDPEIEKHTVPIDIVLKPRKKRSVKLGAGYGTDDGLRLQAAWSYRNLTGRADRLTFNARRSDILENLYAEYLIPYFLSSRNNLIATAGFKREEKDYYTLHQTSSEVNLYRKLEAYWFSTFGYNLEINRPQNVRVEDSQGLVDPRDTENYLVSSVKFNIERNTVDDVLNSREGTAVTLSIEDASRYLGSEISYLRPGIEAKAFVPLPWDLVLAGRVAFRTIEQTGDTDYIPISKQFFLGGSKSVRGYGFEKLGVIDENDVIRSVSGLSSFTGNMELRFPIYKEFGGVVFLDSGALYESSFTFNINSLRYTSGLGLRYNTIIGPIQLDFGYQLNPAKSTASDDPLLVNLLNKDRWYIHFNIGQTF